MPSSDLVSAARLGRDFYDRPVAQVAPELVGCVLLVGGVGGTIVEVERYQDDDPASHSFRGARGRGAVMFGPPGVAYVYRSYGIHWCMNAVCDAPGRGAAVLVRALAPEYGLHDARARRGGVGDRQLFSGPGRLTQALGVDGSYDGTSLIDGPVAIHERPGSVSVARAPRIGITKAVERPWRYVLDGSPHLSRPLPRGGRAAAA